MTKHPTVCIDCAPLLVRSAGVKTYLYHWLRALQALCPDNIKTFLSPTDLEQLQHDGGLHMHPSQILSLLALNVLPQFAMDFAAPSCHIFHVSNLLHKSPGKARLSATLHDVTPWLLPQAHTAAMVAADQAFATRTLANAAGIIAVSQNTKTDAVRVLGLPADKIHVIHLGIPRNYFAVPPLAVAESTARFQLSRPYCLFVGTIEPRKNVDVLLDAWDALPRNFRDEYELVIAGMPGWRSDATMRRIRMASEEKTIRYLGYVPEASLPGLIAGAVALLYPSLYEGFGIPVAQAMAAGCPVITSNVSSLPEVTGGAALLIDPKSVNELTAAIAKLDSPELRKSMSEAGIVQASRFTWEAAAKASFDYFAAIA